VFIHLYIPLWNTLTLPTGCREFLLECAQKVGVEGAAKFLEDPNNGVKEVFPPQLFNIPFGCH